MNSRDKRRTRRRRVRAAAAINSGTATESDLNALGVEVPDLGPNESMHIVGYVPGQDNPTPALDIRVRSDPMGIRNLEGIALAIAGRFLQQTKETEPDTRA